MTCPNCDDRGCEECVPDEKDATCNLCDALADYVTDDLDNLCERCTSELQAGIRYWIER